MFTLVEELDMRRKKVSGTVIRFFNIKKIFTPMKNSLIKQTQYVYLILNLFILSPLSRFCLLLISSFYDVNLLNVLQYI